MIEERLHELLIGMSYLPLTSEDVSTILFELQKKKKEENEECSEEVVEHVIQMVQLIYYCFFFFKKRLSRFRFMLSKREIQFVG